jgi:hypothetical protein
MADKTTVKVTSHEECKYIRCISSNAVVRCLPDGEPDTIIYSCQVDDGVCYYGVVRDPTTNKWGWFEFVALTQDVDGVLFICPNSWLTSKNITPTDFQAFVDAVQGARALPGASIERGADDSWLISLDDGEITVEIPFIPFPVLWTHPEAHTGLDTKTDLDTKTQPHPSDRDI